MVIAGFLIWVLVVLSNSAEDEKEVKKGEPIDKVTNSPTDLDSGVSTVAFGLVLINLLICLITGAMDCYFFYVVKRCYGFFKDKIALCKRAPIIGETMPMPEVINSLEYRVSL